MALPLGSIFATRNAVFFDLDNTLIDRDQACDRFFTFLLSSFYEHLTPNGAAWTERMETLRALDQGGRGSKTAIYQYCFGDDPGLSPDAFVKLMHHKIASFTTWSDGAEKLLKCLRNRKHPIALVTNGSQSQRLKIEAINASGYFDAVLISEEVGISKPDPGIFIRAMSQLDSTPDQSVFIGDSLEHDMTGARNVGMMTVYFKKEVEEDNDVSLCDLVVYDLRKLTDMITALEA